MAESKRDEEFEAWTAERERSIRAKGEFDVADMYRELRDRVLCAPPEADAFDCETFDRGRPRALVLLLGHVPSWLTFDPEEVALGR